MTRISAQIVLLIAVGGSVPVRAQSLEADVVLADVALADDTATESASTTTRPFARPRASGSEAEPHADAQVALHDRLPFLAPGWHAIATAGYRLQVGRQAFDHVDVVDVRAAHGFTAGLLLPLIASGTASSRTRLAFALGLGADFAVGRYAETYPYRSDEGLRYQVPAYAERTTHLYGQVAVVLRARLRARVALTTSLAWLPGARLVRIGGEDVPRRGPGFFGGLPPVIVSREWARSFERARLGVGVQVGALHAGVFFGATARDGLFFGRRQELDVGAQLGAGW